MKKILTAGAAAILAAGCGGGAKAADSAARGDTNHPAPAPAAATDSTAGAPGGATSGVAPGNGGADQAASSARDGKLTAAGERRVAGRGSTRDTGAATPAGGGEVGVTRSASSDSARGVVAVVGTSFDSRVIVRPQSGGPPVTLTGAHARTVGRLSGADVWVSGTRDERGQLNVNRFVVRSVDGNPALDGTLIARGDRLVVVTGDGTQHAIANPPAALRDHVGARVWVTGALDKGPITYGVIEERR